MTNSYGVLAGHRLVMVENTPSAASYSAVREATRHGLEITLMTRGPAAYHPVVGFDTDPLRDVAEVVEVETNDVEALVSCLRGRGDTAGLGVLSFSDYYCGIAARVAARLGRSQSADAVEAGVYKDRLRALTAHRPYGVRYRVVRHLPEVAEAITHLGLPLIVKPPAEGNSVGVRLARTPGEAQDAVEQILDMRTNWRGQQTPGYALLEEYLTGTEVSVETVSRNGRHHVYGITSKGLSAPPTFLELTHSFPYRLPAEVARSVEAVVTDMLDVVGLRDGPCHTEVKITSTGPKIVELNPRLPGHHVTTMVEDVFGTNPFLDAMVVAVGAPRTIPTHQRGGAAVAVLYPPAAGRLDRVDGTEEAASLPGVRFVQVDAAAGAELRAPTDNYSGFGRVYARGEDAADALRIARRALSCLVVHLRTPAGREGMS